MRIYFDTNVYTALADAVTDGGLEQLASAAALEGHSVLLSPVNLLEFGALEGTLLKERLVRVAQHLCEPLLLPDVEMLLVGQIALATEDARLSDIPGSCPGAQAQESWASTWADHRRTVAFPRDTGQRLGTWKECLRLIHLAASRGVPAGELFPLKEIVSSDLTELREAKIKALKAQPARRTRSVSQPEIAMLLATFILGAGLTPFPQPIDEMWRRLGLDDRLERLYYLRDLPSEVWSEGPIGMLCATVTWQCGRKYDRGGWFDAYHLQYLQMPVSFYTLDRAVVDYCRSTNSNSRLFKAVHHAEELVIALKSRVANQQLRL